MATIKRLRLNCDDGYVNERATVVENYCLHEITWEYMCAKYPFIAEEMRRQNFDTELLPNMRRHFLARRNR